MPLKLAASALLFDEAGCVLLIHESYGRRRWGPPGGRVEDGETPWLAAVRETREEVNIDVAVDHLVGLYLVISDQSLLNFAFRCTILAGTPTPGHPDEISEIGWFEADQLPSLMTNSGPHAIADAVRGERGVFREVPKVR